MAVLPIRITGDPVLHSPAVEVEDFDDELRTLVADMYETMELAPGVGLAAPQVGVNLRLFVYHWVDDDDVLWRGEAINPQLWISPPPIGAADEDEESEGCLSIPGERFPLRRGELAILTGVNLEGEPFEIKAEGWLARIFQHEYDHLDGILYADRLEAKHAKAAAREIKRNGWGVDGLEWMPGVDNLDE
ncbi:peptide deformylase [Conyzicola lurida]|uniref:Peptide deformylase n=1 Tax=Conyzicola lurida TaxID=1172621 RepID=A0A841AJH4_9MICO|nr:peptide deformylase [Conyzicola lurida]MBB5843367.1 peptide deformylase [Conyzicola lurida]